MIDCARFRDLLYRYIDDELAERERVSLEEHRDECEGCGRSLEIERRWDSTLREQLARRAAPPELGVRIRERIAGIGTTRVVASPWMRLAPAFSAAAALLIIVALAATPLKVISSAADGQADVAVGMTVDGHVVDLNCDKAGLTIEQQRRCTKTDHLNAVKAGDGHYYAILDRGAGHDLLFGATVRGAPISISGRYDRALDVFEVERFDLEDVGTDAGGRL